MSKLMEITVDNFETEVLESDVPVLADFSAEWCGPCKRLAPIVEEVAGEMSNKAKFVHIDIDANQSIASDYNILSVPTLILFKDGEESDRSIGLISKPTLVDFISKNL